MKSKTFLATFFTLCYLITICQNPVSIVQKSLDAVSFDAFEMSSKLTIHDNKGNQRTRTVQTASKIFVNVTKTISKFTAPAEVSGTSILIHEHTNKPSDMWIYLPATRKVRRIAGSERKGSFMGSEFTHKNMSRPLISDYDYKIIGSTNLGGKACYKIEVQAKSAETKKLDGFAKQIYWVEKTSQLNQKIQFLDQNDKLLKTLTLADYRKQSNGKYFCYTMEMKNEINGRRSVIETLQFSLGSSKTETAFSPAVFQN